MESASRERYHALAKVLHWSLVTVIGLQFLSILLMHFVFAGISIDTLINIHVAIGLLVIPLAVFLFTMRFIYPVSKTEMQEPGWQEVSAVLMHYALYIMLILLPLSGIAYAGAIGIPLSFFGLFTLPAMFKVGSSIGFAIAKLHGPLAFLIGILIIGHFAAAIYHHLIVKDDILARMVWFLDSKKEKEESLEGEQIVHSKQ